jgi:hypothetical protein
LEEKVEAPGPGLRPLSVFQDEVAQTKQSWVLADPVLEPTLVQFGMVLQPDAFWLRVLE